MIYFKYTFVDVDTLPFVYNYGVKIGKSLTEEKKQGILRPQRFNTVLTTPYLFYKRSLIILTFEIEPSKQQH